MHLKTLRQLQSRTPSRLGSLMAIRGVSLHHIAGRGTAHDVACNVALKSIPQVLEIEPRDRAARSMGRTLSLPAKVRHRLKDEIDGLGQGFDAPLRGVGH